MLVVPLPGKENIINDLSSAGFTYRRDRLKPRASSFKGPLAKVYNIFNVIGLSLYAVITYCTF